MRKVARTSITVVGIVVAAVATGFLMVPAAKQLGTMPDFAVGAATVGFPVLAILAITGATSYGWPHSVVIAVVVAALTCAVAAVAAMLTVDLALGGSLSGGGARLLLYGVPAVAVVIFGSIALTLAGERIGSSSASGAITSTSS